MACHSHPHRQGHLVELDCHATLKETFPSKFFITLICFNLSSITPNPVVRMKHALSSVIKAIQTIVWRKVAMSNITHSQFYLTLKTQYINFWLNMSYLQRWRYKSPKNFQRACPSPAMRSRTRIHRTVRSSMNTILVADAILDSNLNQYPQSIAHCRNVRALGRVSYID